MAEIRPFGDVRDLAIIPILSSALSISVDRDKRTINDNGQIVEGVKVNLTIQSTCRIGEPALPSRVLLRSEMRSTDTT